MLLDEIGCSRCWLNEADTDLDLHDTHYEYLCTECDEKLETIRLLRRKEFHLELKLDSNPNNTKWINELNNIQNERITLENLFAI